MNCYTNEELHLRLLQTKYYAHKDLEISYDLSSLPEGRTKVEIKGVLRHFFNYFHFWGSIYIKN